MEGEGALRQDWVYMMEKGKERKRIVKKGENLINKMEWKFSKIKHTGHKRQNLLTYTLELSASYELKLKD